MKLSRHANIVEFFEAVMYDSMLYIVMEDMRGGSLVFILQEPCWTSREPALALVVREVLSALAFLHSHSRIHRDVKANNVLVGLDGLPLQSSHSPYELEA
jgi:serine/threonine protein kinase